MDAEHDNRPLTIEEQAAGIRPDWAPPVVVHLVHGTWPSGFFGQSLQFLRRFVPGRRRYRKWLWFEAGSEFWMDLATRVTCRCEFMPFVWSGANSLQARLAAAQRLRDEIAHVRNLSYVEPCQLLVAHSHGGNIAIWAATERFTSWGQEHHRSPSDCYGVATMGTPFLHLRHRIPEPRHRRVFGFLQWMALMILFWVTFRVSIALTTESVAAQLVWPSEPPNLRWTWPGLTDVTDWLPAVLLGMVFALILMSIDAVIRLRDLGEPVHKGERGTRTALFERRAIPGLLVLRAPGDEAGVVLATTQVADLLLAPIWRLMRGILPLLTRVFTDPRAALVLAVPLFLSGPSVTAILRYFTLDEPWSVAVDLAIGRHIVPHVLDAAWQWLRPVVVAAIPFSIATLLLIVLPGSLLLFGGLVLMPFGWEFIANGLLLEVTAEATPPGGTYAVETLQEPRSVGLRHSMHELEVTRERLAAWIDARYAAWLAENEAREAPSS